MKKITLTGADTLTIENGEISRYIQFNEQYRGFYPAVRFYCAGFWETLGYIAAGETGTGEAIAVQSRNGEVWKTLNLSAFTIERGILKVKSPVMELYFSEREQTLFLFCRDGQIIALPDCPACVKIFQRIL